MHFTLISHGLARACCTCQWGNPRLTLGSDNGRGYRAGVYPVIGTINVPTMKTILAAAMGGAIGTLLYTYFQNSAHELDWGRALFVGVFSGLCNAVFYRRKLKQ